MKHFIIILVFFTITINAKSQHEGIIYTNYDPDWCLESKQYQPADSIKLDLDKDGVTDFAISMYYFREIQVMQIPLEGLEYRTMISDDETDTLVSSAPMGWESRPDFNKATKMYGVKKTVNDTTIYYGWFNEVFHDSTVYGTNPIIKEWICVHDMAFCTIPNYPLRWGQTNLDDGVSESNSNGFVMLQPNPTTGLFTITGEGLKQIEIYDALGQEIASVKAKGDQTIIDLTSQPAGVYLVSVTDTEGRRCVKKVVKE